MSPNSDRGSRRLTRARRILTVSSGTFRDKDMHNVGGRSAVPLSSEQSADLLVRSVNVLAGPVSARVPVALVDVVRAVRPGEARCTRALVAVLERATLGPVSTGRGGAVILPLAVLA